MPAPGNPLKRYIDLVRELWVDDHEARKLDPNHLDNPVFVILDVELRKRELEKAMGDAEIKLILEDK